MTASTGASQDQRSPMGVAGELAYYAGVGASQLEEAVRTIDESLFLVFADADLADGPPTFAPQALADLAAALERIALNVNASSMRLTALGAKVARPPA